MNPNTNISQELLETVERYLNQNMPLEELSEFENKINVDSEFKTQVDDIKTLLLGIESQSLKEQLEGFHDEIPQVSVEENTSKVRFLQFRKLAVAAVLIIAAGSFWFLNQNSNDKLYADYFSPDPGLPTTMSENSNFEFYDAMVNYKQGDYKIAINKWKAIQDKNDTLNYFLGVAHLANKDTEIAIEFLEKATKTKDFPLLSDAHYYLGLAYLKEDNLEKAKSNLQNSTLKSSKDLLSKLRD